MARQADRQVNIRPLNEGGARELRFQSNLSQAQLTRNAKVHTFRRRFGWVLTLAVLIIGIVSVSSGMRGYNAIASQVTTANKTLATAKASGVKLKQQKKDLNDKAYLQNYVREKLMYTKSGEVVFSLPNGGKS